MKKESALARNKKFHFYIYTQQLISTEKFEKFALKTPKLELSKYFRWYLLYVVRQSAHSTHCGATIIGENVLIRWLETIILTATDAFHAIM